MQWLLKNAFYAGCVALAVIACIGLRVGYVTHYADYRTMFAAPAGDADDFFGIAYTLKETGRYARPNNTETPKIKAALLHGEEINIVAGGADAWRPPAWTFMLALILKFSGGNVFLIYMYRFIMDGVTVVIFSFILSPFPWRMPVKILCLFLFALHPTWLLYSSTFLSEPLTLLVLLLSILIFQKLADGRRCKVLAVCFGGFTIGISIFAHSFYLLFPFLTAGFLFQSRHLSFRRAVMVIVFATIPALVWSLRNMVVFQSGMPLLSTSAGSTISRAYTDTFLGMYRNNDEVRVQDPVPPEGLTVVQCNQWRLNYTRDYALSHWRLLPAMFTRKLVGACTPFPEEYRAGILENGRTVMQLLTFLPTLWVLFAGLRIPGYPRSFSAPPLTEEPEDAKTFQVFAWTMRGLFGGYVLMAMAGWIVIRYRAPLIGAEILCFGWAVQVALRWLLPTASCSAYQLMIRLARTKLRLSP
ncbi:MAG: hypothetical protein WC708_13465 [Lentisphaeria bacterium]